MWKGRQVEASINPKFSLSPIGVEVVKLAHFLCQRFRRIKVFPAGPSTRRMYSNFQIGLVKEKFLRQGMEAFPSRTSRFDRPLKHRPNWQV